MIEGSLASKSNKRVKDLAELSSIDEDSDGRSLGYSKRFQSNKNTRRPNQLLICKYCGKTYTKLYNIRDHVNMHRGQGPDLEKKKKKRLNLISLKLYIRANI